MQKVDEIKAVEDLDDPDLTDIQRSRKRKRVEESLRAYPYIVPFTSFMHLNL